MFKENITLGNRIEITESELAKIVSANPTAAFTMQDVQDGRLYAVEAVLIDSNPTRNRNEYTPKWQESMVAKWIGSKLVYSEDDHQPDAPDEYGWIYSAALETVGQATQTVARMVIPVIADTTRLVERLRAGLNHAVSIAVEVDSATCKECAHPVNPRSGRCDTHPGAITVMQGGGTPIHVALVGDPGCRNAGIRATSESIRIVETAHPPEPDPVQTILIEDAKRVRTPVIGEAVKYARLNRPETAEKELTARLEKWSLDEINMYRDAQREAYLKAHPDATRQLAFGGEPTQDSKPYIPARDMLKTLMEDK